MSAQDFSLVAPAYADVLGHRRIGTNVPATAQSVVFDAIPGDYTDLLLIGVQRASLAQPYSAPYARLNGDGGGNYDWQEWWGVSGGSSAAEGIAQTEWQISNATGAAADAGTASIWATTIRDYANTRYYKTFESLGGVHRGTGSTNHYAMFHSGSWRSTAPIVRIEIWPWTPGAGEVFVAGSVLSLYALR